MKQVDIIKVLDSYGFAPCILDDGVECQVYTPAGEDFNFYLEGKDESEWANSLKCLAEEFDVDEHVELCILRRGHNGVTPTIDQLVKDAEWIKDALIATAEDVG